jgi:hypothetical protein
MSENWRPVVGFEGLYEVSDLGRVRSVTREIPYVIFGKETSGIHHGKLKSTKRTDRGYVYLNLYKNNKEHPRKVHRLVMEAFLGPSRMEINHKDADKENNSLSNLEYCTRLENMAHAKANGLIRNGAMGKKNAN